MHERRRRPDRGDIHGPAHGDYSDFTDWDNPEDAVEDVEDTPGGGYGPSGAEDDDSYVPGPDDPDYDLSEAAGYAGWESPRRDGLLPRWVLVAATIVLILAMLAPLLIRIR